MDSVRPPYRASLVLKEWYSSSFVSSGRSNARPFHLELVSTLCYSLQTRHCFLIPLGQGAAPTHDRRVCKCHACMVVPVASIKLHYIWEFGQLTSLSIPPVQDRLTFLLPLVQQPGNGLPSLLSIISIASDWNFTYPIRL